MRGSLLFGASLAHSLHPPLVFFSKLACNPENTLKFWKLAFHKGLSGRGFHFLNLFEFFDCSKSKQAVSYSFDDIYLLLVGTLFVCQLSRELLFLNPLMT